MMANERDAMGRFGKTLIYSSVGVLSLGALYAIGVVLFGEFDEFELKVMGTTFIIGGGSFGWLCCSMFSSRNRQPVPGMAGMALVATAAVLLINGIWAETESDAYWKTAAILSIWAAVVSHLLVLLSLSLPRGHRWLYVTTGLTTAMLAGLISYIIVTESVLGEGLMKFIIVLAILAALATVVIPILSRMTKPAEPAHVGASLTLTKQPDGTFADANGQRYRVEEINSQSESKMMAD